MTLLFILAAAAAVAGALGVILARPPVHSLLGLLLLYASLAVLFLSLSAEFLALMQIIVYAGAIMVLFLFVIGLLTVRTGAVEGDADPLPGQRTASGIVAAALALVLVGVGAVAAGGGVAALGEGYGSVRFVGEGLFFAHVFPLQLAALVLLVAAVGVAMLLGRRHVRGSVTAQRARRARAAGVR